MWGLWDQLTAGPATPLNHLASEPHKVSHWSNEILQLQNTFWLLNACYCSTQKNNAGKAWEKFESSVYCKLLMIGCLAYYNISNEALAAGLILMSCRTMISGCPVNHCYGLTIVRPHKNIIIVTAICTCINDLGINVSLASHILQSPERGSGEVMYSYLFC